MDLRVWTFEEIRGWRTDDSEIEKSSQKRYDVTTLLLFSSSMTEVTWDNSIKGNSTLKISRVVYYIS